jgi:hypothetical protein
VNHNFASVEARIIYFTLFLSSVSGLCVNSALASEVSFIQTSVQTSINTLPKPDQEPWQLKLDKPDVKIYVRPVNGSEFLQTKAVLTLNASKQKVMALFPKDKGCWRWVERCKKSLIVGEMPSKFSGESPDEVTERKPNKVPTTLPVRLLSYTALNMPWPLTDRDFLFVSSQIEDPESQSTTLTLSPAEPEHVTKYGSESAQKTVAKMRKKHVRGAGNMTYRIEPDVPDIVDVDAAENASVAAGSNEVSKSRVTIIMHTEFVGNAPVSIINGKLVEELAADVANLRKLLY